jgi:pyrophosphate--fructose-6-phosphate 1-phosphotransferase
MGRSASHIALECALNTRINCCIIGEEVAAKKQTLMQIANFVADIIVERWKRGKNYGVIIVPEGLVEFIPEMGKLISEINEIVSHPFEGDVAVFVESKLSVESKAVF